MRLTVFCLLLAVVPAGAQPRERKQPVYYAGEAQPAKVLPPSLRGAMPPPREIALEPLTSSELSALQERGMPLRVGIHRELPAEALQASSWETAGGRRVWRMAVRSAGSAAMRVQFTEFDVGAGQVWVHGAGEIAGPYTGRGSFGDGQFWSDSIASDSITVEYQPEPGREDDDRLPFQIQAVAHRAETAPQGGNGDRADTCHLDPNCYPEWHDSMKMVGQIVFEQDGHEYMCSGALVATRNNNLKPYFLTAGHCVHDEAVARSVQAYWTYQTSGCRGVMPLRKDSIKSAAGAHLLASGGISEGDYSLLLLRDVPGGVWFAGWDPGEPGMAAPLVGIHHPKGSYKRISFGRRVNDIGAVVEGAMAPANEFYQVLWDKGRTEPGSSGSPLFSGPGVIVGMLSYGPFSPVLTSCQISPSIDGYGRLSIAYPAMRDYLEDLPGSAVVPAPGNIQFQVSNGSVAGASSRAVTLTTQSENPVQFKARADAAWIKVSAVTGKASASSAGVLTVSIDPAYLTKAGNYSSTVTITSGAAPPQFLNVRAEASVVRSAVEVSFSPNPVLEQPPDDDGARWAFKVRLEEKAGVATRLSTLKINGTDYSGYIKEWFGSDRLEPTGALEATLRATGPRGDQYFEFGGMDEGTNRTWYQSVTVQFVASQP